MATVTKGRTFVSGETVTPTKLNELVDNATVTAIQTADISDSAVTDAKIASGVDASKLTAGTLPIARIADGAVTPAKLSQPYTLATSQASTSGTSIDFTGIPSWARKITVMLAGVSVSGTSNPVIRLGTSGGVVTTGYVGAGSESGASTNAASFTSGFGISSGLAANTIQGAINLFCLNASSNVWVASGVTAQPSNPFTHQIAGTVTLSGTLDRIRITTVNGTDTFDAGSINISYEG